MQWDKIGIIVLNKKRNGFDLKENIIGRALIEFKKAFIRPLKSAKLAGAIIKIQAIIGTKSNDQIVKKLINQTSKLTVGISKRGNDGNLFQQIRVVKTGQESHDI